MKESGFIMLIHITCGKGDKEGKVLCSGSNREGGKYELSTIYQLSLQLQQYNYCPYIQIQGTYTSHDYFHFNFCISKANIKVFTDGFSY